MQHLPQPATTDITQVDKDDAVWFQNDAAYLHKVVAEYRARGTVVGDWLALRTQPALAHSSKMARIIMGIEE